jgi:hypothetical protein
MVDSGNIGKEIGHVLPVVLCDITKHGFLMLGFSLEPLRLFP